MSNIFRAASAQATYKELAVRDVRHRAGSFYGDPEGARAFAVRRASERIMSPPYRRIYIKQAVHTLQFGMNV